jgi:hypothetical protein
MLAMIASFPPQRAQDSMSTPNTRFSRRAQFISTGRGVARGSAPSSACGFLPLPRATCNGTHLAECWIVLLDELNSSVFSGRWRAKPTKGGARGRRT